MTLTTRQQDAMDFIRGFINDHGYSPSIREIADGIGSNSTSLSRSDVIALEDAGYLKVTPGIARGIVLLEKEAVK